MAHAVLVSDIPAFGRWATHNELSNLRQRGCKPINGRMWLQRQDDRGKYGVICLVSIHKDDPDNPYEVQPTSIKVQTKDSV